MNPARAARLAAVLLLAGVAPAQFTDELAILQAKAVSDGVLRTLGQALRGHSGWVVHVDLSPDGKRCVTAGAEGLAKIWDLAEGGPPIALSGHDGGLQFAAFVADGKQVLTLGDDETLRIWNATSGAEESKLELGAVHTAAALSPDGRYLASAGRGTKSVEIRDLATLEVEQTVPFDESVAADCAWSPDGRYLAIGGIFEPKVVIWDRVLGKVQVERGLERGGASVAIRQDGKALAIGGYDSIQTFGFPDLGDAAIHEVSGMESNVRGLAWRDEKSVLFGDSDGALGCVELDGPSLIWGVHEHHDQVPCIALASDCSFVATCSHDQSLRFWNAADGTERLQTSGNRDMVRSVAWSKNGDLCVGGDFGNVVAAFDVATGKTLTRVVAHEFAVLAVAVAGGKRIVSAGQDNTLTWIDPTGDGTDEPQHIALEGDELPALLTGAFVEDRFAGGFGDGQVRIFDAGLGKQIASFKAQEAPILHLAWNMSGTRLATLGDDGSIKVFDAEGTELCTPATGLEDDAELAFAGDLLVTGNAVGAVRIYDSTSGAETLRFDVLTDPDAPEAIQAMCTSPDGKRLATLTASRITLWSIADGALEQATSSYTSVPSSGAFSPDGKSLATGMIDATILVWDLSRLPKN